MERPRKRAGSVERPVPSRGWKRRSVLAASFSPRSRRPGVGSVHVHLIRCRSVIRIASRKDRGCNMKHGGADHDGRAGAADCRIARSTYAGSTAASSAPRSQSSCQKVGDWKDEACVRGVAPSTRNRSAVVTLLLLSCKHTVHTTCTSARDAFNACAAGRVIHTRMAQIACRGPSRPFPCRARLLHFSW